MSNPQRMSNAVHAYVAAFEAGDPDAVAMLYAEDATVEDPVGAPIHRGRDAIRAFYGESMKTGAKLRLEGSVRIVADYAVFPLSVTLHYDGSDKRIDAIDSFKFNDHDQVIEMRAFWGPGNMHGL